MKRFLPILIAAMLAGCHAVHAATITYGITNFNATAATNTLRITPISGPSFDGRYIVTGVPITTGTTNGNATNVLSAGNYLLELIRPSITNVAIRSDDMEISAQIFFYSLSLSRRLNNDKVRHGITSSLE